MIDDLTYFPTARLLPIIKICFADRVFEAVYGAAIRETRRDNTRRTGRLKTALESVTGASAAVLLIGRNETGRERITARRRLYAEEVRVIPTGAPRLALLRGELTAAHNKISADARADLIIRELTARRERLALSERVLNNFSAAPRESCL